MVGESYRFGSAGAQRIERGNGAARTTSPCRRSIAMLRNVGDSNQIETLAGMWGTIMRCNTRLGATSFARLLVLLGTPEVKKQSFA